MKKVCIFLPYYLPVPNVKGGAIETLITNLIEENERQNKIQFTIISLFDKEAYRESKKFENTKFIYIKKNILKIILNRFYIKVKKQSYYNIEAIKKISKERFDYIIAEGEVADNAFSKLLDIGYEKKNLITHIHHNVSSNPDIEKIFGKIITISEFCKKTWLENSEKNSDDILILKNGIDLKKFDKDLSKEEKENLRNKLELKKEDFVVIYCGRLIEVKGVKELILAINNIKNDNIKLLIVGSPNFQVKTNSKYVDEIKKISQNEKIKYTGYIKNDELYKYYKIADAMVIPSLWEEAAGLVCIEGMITKTPLIVTKSGGMVEYIDKKSIIVEKDKNVIKNIENAILELYNTSEDEIEEKKKEEYIRAKLFDKTNYYKNFIKIIEQL